MRPYLLLIAGSACLFLASGQAVAGQCSQEIAALEKALSSTDAGMGPTDTDMAESPDATATDTDTAQAGDVPGTEATTAMNEATEGTAASPEDVQRQNTGEPTAAEAAQAGEIAPAAGQSEVTEPLQRARDLDQAGKEEECMAAVSEAKEKIGIE